MNKKAIFSIVLLGFLLTSILATDLSKAVVVSDQLDLSIGSSVEGKYFFTNTTLTDYFIGYITLNVEDIWATTDTNESVVQLKVEYNLTTGDSSLLNFDDMDQMEMTHLIMKANRTDFLPAARLKMGNSSFWFEVSVLHKDSVTDLINVDNLIITLNNGSIYNWGDYNVSDPEYGELVEYAFAWAIFNGLLPTYWPQTFLAISPTANIGDNINYHPVMGDVIGKPAVTTTTGKSYETIQVKYDTTTFSFAFEDTTSLEVFYEASTGLLLKSIEIDGPDKYEFIPGEVDLAKGIPFAIEGAILGLAALSVAVLYYRKKK